MVRLQGLTLSVKESLLRKSQVEIEKIFDVD
jgi:hypothetical protein